MAYTKEEKRLRDKLRYIANREQILDANRQWHRRNRERVRRRHAEWRRQNPDKVKGQSHRSYLRNREVIRRRVKEYQVKNKEKLSAGRKQPAAKKRRNATWARLYQNPEWRAERLKKYAEYRKKNPEVLRACSNRRRERIVRARGQHTISEWQSRVEYYGWRCYYCNVQLTRKTLVKEHRIPLSRLGTAWPSNLVPSCRWCNTRKHNLTESEFRHKENV